MKTTNFDDARECKQTIPVQSSTQYILTPNLRPKTRKNHFKSFWVLASLTLTEVNPSKTSPNKRASQHDYSLKSWQTRTRETKMRHNKVQ